jgi:hypothetical protein
VRPISVGANLVANTKTTLYTIPKQNVGKWNLLYAINNTASAKNFSAWWYDKSTNTEIAIVDAYPLASKNFLKFDGGAYVLLEEGDEIRVLSETGSTCSCIVTVELEYTNVKQKGGS